MSSEVIIGGIVFVAGIAAMAFGYVLAVVTTKKPEHSRVRLESFHYVLCPHHPERSHIPFTIAPSHCPHCGGELEAI